MSARKRKHRRDATALFWARLHQRYEMPGWECAPDEEWWRVRGVRRCGGLPAGRMYALQLDGGAFLPVPNQGTT